MAFDVRIGDQVTTVCGQTQEVRFTDSVGVRDTIVYQEHGRWEPIIDYDPLIEARITNRMSSQEVGQEVIRILKVEDADEVASFIQGWMAKHGPDEIARKYQ